MIMTIVLIVMTIVLIVMTIVVIVMTMHCLNSQTIVYYFSTLAFCMAILISVLSQAESLA
jgi:hypothetical protein